jgi:hypothetical protein
MQVAMTDKLDSVSLNSESAGRFDRFVSNKFMLRRSRIQMFYKDSIAESSISFDINERGVQIKDSWLKGWVAIAFGIAAFVCFSMPWYATIRKIPPPQVFYKFGRIGVLCAVGHATALGISGWTSAGQWPFLMPPITLIFVVFALFVVVYRYVFCGYRQKEQP